jgi:hypothetical protein
MTTEYTSKKLGRRRLTAFSCVSLTALRGYGSGDLVEGRADNVRGLNLGRFSLLPSFRVNPTYLVSGFDQTPAGIQSYHACVGLDALCVR